VLDRLAASPDLLARYQQRAVALRSKFLWSNEKQKYIGTLRRLTKQAPQTSAEASHGLR
jgi:hypothetical protein